MKKKLEATGKKCLFKNYDVFQPEDDFNFEKRDWMTVHPRELPTGSQLIMGLNPPFGVNAALANKFIDKALEFRPKLLILIVPKETERLDEKRAAYDLIWEDEEKLSGKSFYLPGSVDINDNQIEQWNVKPPLLYLWSRPDWTAKHMAIALKHGHISNASKEPHLEADEEPTSVQPEGRRNRDIHSKVISDLPKEQNNRAVGYEEKGAHPNVQAGTKLEIDIDVKETAKHSDMRKSQKTHVKVKKRSGKRKSKMQDETPGTKTADDASDMSISPPRQTDPQLAPKIDLPLDAHLDGATGPTGFNRPTQGFGTTYGGEWNGGLSRNDIDSLERKYVGGDVDNLEGRFGRGDIDNLDRRFATSSWNGSFSSSPYDLPNNSMGRLSLESCYGVNERFSGYIRDSPLPPFESSPYLGEEGRIRADMHSSLRTYGQQEPDNVRRSWHAESRSGSMLPQTGPLSSSFGSSGPAVGSSAMNRYAPRLDELNYSGPRHSMSHTSVLGSRPSFTPDPGSQSGWLDD